jgi:type I restriction enzyme, S subunit
MAVESRTWQEIIDSAPPDWDRLPLKKIFRERKETGRGDLPLLAVTGGQGIIPRDELRRRDTSNSDKSKYLRVAPGDLAYNTMRMWQGVSGVSSHEGIVSPAYTVCALRDSHDPDFMGYLCKLPLLIGRFHAYSQGIVSDTLSLRFHQFGEIVAPIPTATEQRKIAAILSSVDDAIAATQKVIERTNRAKQGLLSTLMTRGIGHTRFKKTEIGEIPEAWEAVRFADLFNLSSGKPRPELTEDGRIPVLGGNGIMGFCQDPLITFPTVVIGRVGHYCGVVHLTAGAAWISDNALYVTDHDGRVLTEFLPLLMNHVDLTQARSRSSQPLVTQGGIGRLKGPLPPLDEQRAIVEQTVACERSVESDVSLLDSLSALKRGLMQDLLTGRVRVQPD